ncbi:chaperonin 10-like protein [Camillea tinctor]|nr:chaperonin 10-like protein [Camillea tinctor]
MTVVQNSDASVRGQFQTAVVQESDAASKGSSTIPLTISRHEPIPSPPPGHALIRVLAVALNPTDHKMPTHFPMPGSVAGCDFCGVVVEVAHADVQVIQPGTRVCGNVFAYNPALPLEGSFAQYVVADARQLLRVPSDWTDIQAAALGGVGWKTAALALWDSESLALTGRPSRPAQDGAAPVIVYGGATATGTMACQLLKASGYTPIAVASPASAALARKYGAYRTVSYLSTSCARDIQDAAGVPIRHALDCITDAESVPTCFGALSRRGGNYACLEAFPEAWHTRRAVRAAVVMAYETTGVAVDLGEGSEYTRPAREDRHVLGIEAAAEVQQLLDQGLLSSHPAEEVQGGWQGILDGLQTLRGGRVKGKKLIVRIPQI